MVLEELDRPQDGSQDTFSESLPSNDADPYAGDHSPTVLDGRSPNYIAVNAPPHQVFVNLNNVPKRFRFIGGEAYPAPVIHAIHESCKQASGILNRPLKQEEADALAYHLGRAIRISSYGSPVGMAIASLVAYRGISKLRFPGWTPGERFSPEKFGPLTGTRAKIMWQASRFGAYWLVGMTLGQVFFSSYALTAGSAGRLVDPRTKELSEAIRKRTQNGRMIEGINEDRTAGPRNGETMDMAKQRRRAQEAQDAWRRRREEGQAQTSARTQDDDMSPTGGAFEADYVDMESAHVTDTGMMSDEQARRSSQRLEAQQRADYEDRSETQRPSQQAGPQKPQDKSQSSPSSWNTSAPTSGGSAWERLRHQAASGSQQQTSSRTTASNRSSSNSDSFSFSSGDEDRQLARGEAQKDFDARLEQERQGKDFDDRNSGRRW